MSLRGWAYALAYSLCLWGLLFLAVYVPWKFA